MYLTEQSLFPVKGSYLGHGRVSDLSSMSMVAYGPCQASNKSI